jgi:hypothetical protein
MELQQSFSNYSKKTERERNLSMRTAYSNTKTKQGHNDKNK